MNPELMNAAKKAEDFCAPIFGEIDENCRFWTEKVLRAFVEERVSAAHLGGTTGYGYDDAGREVMERIAARVFSAEKCLFRSSFASGTHALTVMLFGVLRPGDTIISVTGEPYDTLQRVVRGKGVGGLEDFGIRFDCIPLTEDHKIDLDGVKDAAKKARVIYIQRSRGYALRPSLAMDEVEKAISAAKESNPNVLVLVDQCYCEFVEQITPTQAGADLMAGSLIKNAGGGVARTGGYIAGKKEWVEQCAYRLTAPGIGDEIGCTLDTNRDHFRGMLLAPEVTAAACKTAVFAASLAKQFGFGAAPEPNDHRADIVQTLLLDDSDLLIAFCRGLQAASPVDSFAAPEPAPMPGYDCPVIMAAGAFVQGSSIELSADAPLRPPYAVFLQGGLTYELGKLGVLSAMEAVLKIKN
ncbi:MAG: methionine gamma-lyase family protein [Oscillospiraceae bacterium]|nr:methionine gamma-lyase family protein [Oscillospiraceae bacterium]